MKGGSVMDEEKRDTVVVENDRRRSPIGWIVALVLVVLIILFLVSGGFGLFGGGDTTNVETPETINVQPTTGQ